MTHLHVVPPYLSFPAFASILLLSVGSLFAGHPPDRSESWGGIIETAGLWGSMQLKLTQQGDTWKGESTFNIGGNEQTRRISEFKATGSKVSFSTDLQAMDIHMTLRFSGKRYENELRGSFAAIRSDGTVTSGTWELQSQESNQPGEKLPTLPAPTGRYAIGRTSFHWRDSSRQEVMTDDPKDVRELMAHIWYPSKEQPDSPRASYFPELDAVQSRYGESRQTAMRSFRAHAVNNAPLTHRKYPYPVLIVSPGGGVSGFFYTAIIEDLASRGFIVVAIDHPYESQPVVFPNDRIAQYNEGEVKDVLKFARERIEVRSADIAFVINELGQMNRKLGMFRGRIDLAHIGAFGHSRGGLAAAMACQKDARLKACLNMDGGTLGGPFYPPDKNANMKSAFMWFVRFKPEPSDAQLEDWKMTRQQWDQNRDRIYSRVNGYFRQINSKSYRVTLNGAVHLTFSDVPLTSAQADLETLALQFRLLRIVRTYTRAFFEETLKGQNSDLLKGASSDYPEITIERFEPRLVH